MGSLLLAQQARELVLSNKPARLYRRIVKEIPRVMQIYDIVHLGEDDCKMAIRQHFYENANVKDERVIDMLLQKAYMDFEETLLQHKQKTHLMLFLEGDVATRQNIKQLDGNESIDVKDARWVD